MAPQKMSRVGRISKFEDKIIEMKSGEQKSKTINTTKLINIYILRVQEGEERVQKEYLKK